MQSLFDACASKMTHKEIGEIAALPTPKTVTNILFRAKFNRDAFRSVYQQRLGDVVDSRFSFDKDGAIVIDRTLANIENSDLKQGFRYNCAFGWREELAAIWQKLSDEDKAALRADRLLIVQFYSILTAGEAMPLLVSRLSFRETRELLWHEAAFNIYQNGSADNQKDNLFITWSAAVLEISDCRREQFCRLVCRMQEEREFEYNDEEREMYKNAIRIDPFPDMRIVRRCAAICGLQEFEDLVVEVVGERGEPEGSQ